MTTVVQSVAANGLGGVSSKTFTISSTTAGNLIVIECGVEGGASTYTGFTVTDNGTGNTWSSAVSRTAIDFRIAAVLYCLSISAGVTSITVTPTGGTGGIYGAMSVQEISGGAWSLDKTGNGVVASGTVTVTNSGANVGTTNFVAGAISTGNGAANCAITDPPTGYTSAAVSQNDSTDAGGECCYRIDSSAVTDAATWSATSSTNNDPAVLASFKTSTGSVALTGQSATFTAGTATKSTTVAITGQSATFAPGSVSPQSAGTVQLTGQSSTFSAGTLAPSLAVSLAGQSATFSAGTVTTATLNPVAPRFDLFPILGPLNQNQFRQRPRAFANGVTAALTGQSAVFAPGVILASSTVALTGQSATFTTGSVVASGGGNVTLALTGQSSAFAAGALLPGNATALTGQAITSSAGVIGPAGSMAFTGQSATFAAGNLLPSSAIGVAGQSATFTAGNVTAPNGVTLALTGQVGTFSAGSLTSSLTAALIGQSSTSSAGTIAAAKGASLTGSSIASSSGSMLAQLSIPTVGQSATFTTGLLLPPSDKTASLSGLTATFHAGTIVGTGAVLVGSERYQVKRPQKRVFTVSACTFTEFPPKDPAERIPLKFDFDIDLDAGVTLSGTPVVTVTMNAGADPAPTSIFNGLPRFDITSTQVIVPVMGGIDNCDYDIKVVVPTTDSLTILALSGILPVRA